MDKKLSQLELGKSIGKNQTYISDIERGRQVPYDYTIAIMGGSLGLTFHDKNPILWRLIIQAEKERKVKEITRQ